MMRLVPFAVIGFALMALGLGTGAGIVGILGFAVLAGGIAWFLLTGTGTHLDEEARGR